MAIQPIASSSSSKSTSVNSSTRKNETNKTDTKTNKIGREIVRSSNETSSDKRTYSSASSKSCSSKRRYHEGPRSKAVSISSFSSTINRRKRHQDREVDKLRKDNKDLKELGESMSRRINLLSAKLIESRQSNEILKSQIQFLSHQLNQQSYYLAQFFSQ